MALPAKPLARSYSRIAMSGVVLGRKNGESGQRCVVRTLQAGSLPT